MNIKRVILFKIHTDFKADVISFFHFIFCFVSSLVELGSANVSFFNWLFISSASAFSLWITSPSPKSPGVSSLVFFLESSFADASSFLFFFNGEFPLSASDLLCSVSDLGGSCEFGSFVHFLSSNSSFWVSSVGSFVSGADSSACLGGCFAAWKARAFALCFFPSAWRSRVCLLVVLVLQRLKSQWATTQIQSWSNHKSSVGFYK